VDSGRKNHGFAISESEIIKMKSTVPLHLHVVSHTHWDREWYQPFEGFRLRLTDLVDHLLEIFETYPDYVFELDSQTVCLEDYLEIRPEKREILCKYIQSGNLRVGPWYVQNDFFLTSGEATVRNLLLGRRLAREFGRCGDVGYAPDQFGLIRQLPQILSGFGIDSCIFGRGYDGRVKNEFYWQSPDGSRVLASYLSSWYNNLQRLSADPDKARNYAAFAVAQQDETASTSHRLLMNGVDHLEAQEDLPEVLKYLPGFRQSTLRAFIDGVAAEAGERLPTVAAEMRQGNCNVLLQGTLSARVPLKVANVTAQARLEHGLEPWSVMLALASGDWSFYETASLRYAWKLLLQNHPHDTICGCSTERVNDDALNRFARLGDVCDALTSRLTRKFFERLDRNGFAPAEYLLGVFNLFPRRTSEELTAKLYFPLTENITNFELVSPDGSVVEYEVLAQTKRGFSNYPAINLPGKTDCCEVDIRFAACDLPPMGYRVYTIRPQPGNWPMRQTQCRMANDYISFAVDAAGRVTLTDLATGKIYPDPVSFRNESDRGHSYNFIADVDDTEIDLADVSQIKVTFEADSVAVTYDFELPKDYDFDRQTPTAETVANQLTVRYHLGKFDRHLSMDISVCNASAAHRLRLFVRTDPAAVPEASAPFGFEKRSANGDGHGMPDSGIVKVGDLAIFNHGLYEYEPRTDGYVALTLIRCVGRVTNTDFAQQTSGVAEPYEWEAPGGNLIGEIRLTAALRPGPATLAGLENEFHKFITPAVTVFDSADPFKFTSGRPCVQDTALTELFFRPLPPGCRLLPRQSSLLQLSGNAVFSAWKKAEERDAAILRVYNPDFERPCQLVTDDRYAYRRCNLAEEPQAEDNQNFTLRPGEIATWQIFQT